MQIRALDCAAAATAVPVDADTPRPPATRWRWVDIEVDATDPTETAALVSFTSPFGLDSLAVRDAIGDHDLPKLDDFGDSLLVVLHGLAEDRIATYELDCFLVAQTLITVRRERSPAVEALWEGVQRRVELTSGDADELLARLADVLTRRLIPVLDVFDDHNETLVELALAADGSLIREVTTVRKDLAALRRAIHPQREILDELRVSTSSLLSHGGRRRFSDVFDVATRVTSGIDAARTALTETLDAYRGAEAKQATEVSKVLTIYAAILLPLSLIVGYFGMNFENLPGTGTDDGWLVVTIAMAVLTALSLGMFVALGWIRRPSGRDASALVGRGLIEGARAPIELVSAAFEISITPLRTVTGVRRRGHTTSATDPRSGDEPADDDSA
ncbi:MAG: magnesium transporter CorA family protein [Acidimicrobiales bacterium]